MLGKYTGIALAPYVEADIPILYVGFGPKSVEHAGRIYDGVHLHTFMSDEALANSVAAVRRGEAAAVGDPRACARRRVDQFGAGADGIIIHASTPEEFEPVLEEYQKIRPHAMFAGRTNRPG